MKCRMTSTLCRKKRKRYEGGANLQTFQRQLGFRFLLTHVTHSFLLAADKGKARSPREGQRDREAAEGQRSGVLRGQNPNVRDGQPQAEAQGRHEGIR